MNYMFPISMRMVEASIKDGEYLSYEIYRATDEEISTIIHGINSKVLALNRYITDSPDAKTLWSVNKDCIISKNKLVETNIKTLISNIRDPENAIREAIQNLRTKNKLSLFRHTVLVNYGINLWNSYRTGSRNTATYYSINEHGEKQKEAIDKRILEISDPNANATIIHASLLNLIHLDSLILGAEELPETKENAPPNQGALKLSEYIAAEEEEEEDKPSRESIPIRKERLAVQVLLDKAGIVKNIVCQGRPASPFTGMGAHSTAWVVITDNITRRCINKPVKNAFEELKKLPDEYKKLYTQLEDIRFNNDLYARPDQTKQAIESVDTALNNLNQEAPPIIKLQTTIQECLKFYNMIPGVTEDKACTLGRAEGTTRTLLLDNNPITENTRNKLANKLYDQLSNKELNIKFRVHHSEIIKATYPATIEVDNAIQMDTSGQDSKKRGHDKVEASPAEQEPADSEVVIPDGWRDLPQYSLYSETLRSLFPESTESDIDAKLKRLIQTISNWPPSIGHQERATLLSNTIHELFSHEIWIVIYFKSNPKTKYVSDNKSTTLLFIEGDREQSNIDKIKYKAKELIVIPGIPEVDTQRLHKRQKGGKR